MLKRDLASDTLLGIDGKGKINFEKTYSEFIKNVCEAETFIINYIKVRPMFRSRTVHNGREIICHDPYSEASVDN